MNMKKSLREKLISLNGKKVRLILTYGIVEDILIIKFDSYQNGNGRKDPTINVHCGEYGRTLKSILDVIEI